MIGIFLNLSFKIVDRFLVQYKKYPYLSLLSNLHELSASIMLDSHHLYTLNDL